MTTSKTSGEKTDKVPSPRSILGFRLKYGLSHTKTYDEIRRGRLRIKKVGTRSIVTEQAEADWLAALPDFVPSEAA